MNQSDEKSDAVIARVSLLFVLMLMSLCLPAYTSAAETHDKTVGEQREAVLFWTTAQREARFPKLHERFPGDRVDTGAHVHTLPSGQPLTPLWTDGTTLTQYMRKYHIAGVMVLQNGRVRLEQYAEGYGPDTHWPSFSVAKSVTSTLLGIALAQGYVNSLEDTLVTYIPQLRGSAYADVTVRQLLTMTSGVRWNEDYDDPNSDVAQMYMASCQGDLALVVPYLKKLPRQWPAGTHFNYNTAETDLLGVLVQNATGRSLATYLSQTIWQPYGMASDAYWLHDECSGGNTGGSGLQATLPDYARFGLFMLNGGRINGESIIAPAWLTHALDIQVAIEDSERGYGYLWWIDSDDSYAAVGIFGQLVYIDPSRHLVIAQIASWPQADTDEEIAARRAFVAAIKRAVDTPRNK